jgi:hypothetical protein
MCSYRFSSLLSGGRRFARLLLLCSVLGLPAGVHAQEDSRSVRLDRVDIALVDDVYHLSAHVEFPLNDKPLEALHKGVPLTITLDITVSRYRKYWLNETTAHLEQKYQLRYHALADQYILTNINTGVKNNFPSLATALAVMGTIVDLPFLDKTLLDPEGDYTVNLRARLDLDSLPAPLRILAYVTPAWHVSSDWQQWNLEM